MIFLRTLPLYATTALLVAGLVVVADARDWSGVQSGVAGVVLMVFYLAGVVVPWLLREFGHPKARATQRVVVVEEVAMRSENGSSIVVKTAGHTSAASLGSTPQLDLVHR